MAHAKINGNKLCNMWRSTRCESHFELLNRKKCCPVTMANRADKTCRISPAIVPQELWRSSCACNSPFVQSSTIEIDCHTVTHVYKLDCMPPTQTEELKYKTPVFRQLLDDFQAKTTTGDTVLRHLEYICIQSSYNIGCKVGPINTETSTATMLRPLVSLPSIGGKTARV